MYRNSKLCHYYVEGQCEKKIVETFKECGAILPGKIDVLNAAQCIIKPSRLIPLKKGTTVILIFDTDLNTGSVTLDENIKILRGQSEVKEIICVTQVKNLEDELIRSCAIKKIRELTNSKSDSDFKRDVLRVHDFKRKLKEKAFCFSRFWSTEPQGDFRHIKNSAYKIKKI